MGWFTTKDGRHINSDWLTEEARRKYNQIGYNENMAKSLNSKYNIPYDKWQKQEDKREEHYDAPTPYTIHERDETRYTREKDVRKVGKKETLEEVENWRLDDGTYGTGDEAIYIIYEDGKVLELTDGEPHKKWSKQGIRGISVSTGDYTQVWGEDYIPKTKEWVPLETNEFDENDNPIPGYTNSYSGMKFTGEYKVRIRKTSTHNKEKYRWDNKYETVAMSTVKRDSVPSNNEQDIQSSGKLADRLSKKGISSAWDIESWLRGLSSTRRNNIAKELGIADLRGDAKIREMVRRIFAQGKD